MDIMSDFDRFSLMMLSLHARAGDFFFFATELAQLLIILGI